MVATPPRLPLSLLALAALLCSWLAPAAPALAAEPVIIRANQEVYHLGRHLDFLEDRDQQWTIAEVATSPQLAARFQPARTENPGFGFTASAYWLRFTVANTLATPIHYYLEVDYPLLDHIDFFIPSATGDFQVVQGGDQRPFHTRTLRFRNNVFEVKLAAGEMRTYYLRCATTSSMNLPLILLSPAALAQRVSTEQTMLGLYYGILLVMLVYNLFIYLSIRDVTYLYYVFFIASYMLFQLSLNGVAFQFFWPDALWWANTSTPFFIFLSYFFATQFSRSILDTPRNVPRLDKVLLAGMGLALIGIVLSLLVPYAISIRLATVLSLTVFVLMTSGLICTIKGYRPARYYLIAWSVSLAGICVYALKTFAILPHTFITNWGIQIGSAWEVILLSLGLADRLKLIEEEKNEIQQEYAARLEVANRELETFNTELEQLVGQRTEDLSRANESLRLEAHERKLAEKRAEAANQAKSEFLANMSHEIRTPMNAILGMTSLAFQLELPARLKNYLDIIQSSGQSLLRVLNDILDFSKIEAGKLDIEATPFDLRALLEELCDLFGRQVAEKKLELLVSTAPEANRGLIGDPLRLKQVLINLTNNAIKFTEQGEVEIRAELADSTADRAVVAITIRDTGRGIKPETLERLFTAFTQEDSSTTRRFGGTGLGLAISRRLVELMGGAIAVASEPGRGSTFTFTIPFPLQAAPPVSPQLPESLEGLAVLVVAANEASRRWLAGQLAAIGARPTAAADPDQVLEDYGNERWGLLLIDHALAGVSGLEAVTRLRRHAAFSHTPALLMAPIGKEELFEQAEAAGIDGVLLKPVKQSALCQRILELFGLAAALPTAAAAGRPSFAGSRLLLVEDNSINQQVASKMLASVDVDVDIAANGVEALEALRRRDYDAVLMDIQMPTMDGLEATRRIRAEERFATLPIIAMTASAMKGDREECLAAGMNDYLSKPIDSDLLFATLGRWLVAGLAETGEQAAEAPPPAPDALPGLSPAAGLQRLDGDLGLYRSILDEFIESYGDSDSRLRQALAANDPVTAQRIAHTVKGLAANLGMAPLHAAAAAVEGALRNDQPKEAADRIADLEIALGQCLPSIHRFLDESAPEQPAVSPEPPTDGPVRPAGALFAEFDRLLRDHNPEAESALSALKQHLSTAGVEVDDALDRIGRCLDSFDFKAAHREFAAMAVPLGFEAGGE